VSNSSSSSFVLLKIRLKAAQIFAIRHHIELGKELGIKYCSPKDAWEITEDDNTIKLDTFMDNFDMNCFLEKIEARHAIIEHPEGRIVQDL
jgi:hypothetical protein